jgi:sterol desaturase/sphingolipid hydroxylase (fatty acid hydroxylase superfamily)
MDLIETYTSALNGYLNWLWNDQVLVSTKSLFGNYFWGLALISITFFLLEVILPWRKNQAVFRKHFWQDAFYMYFNFFLFYIILFVGLTSVSESISISVFNYFGIEHFGIIYIKDLPTWLQLTIVFLVTDFTHWNIHRMLHKSPRLWKFHRLHHSIKEMGFAGHLRFHWVESIIYKTITYFPLLVIGFETEYLFYMYMITISWGHFNHANINVPLGVFKYVFNTPQMHIWHHAKELPKNHQDGANFGLTLSIWDYIFKTRYEPESGRDIELGFEGDENYPKSFVKQILSGFGN